MITNIADRHGEQKTIEESYKKMMSENYQKDFQIMCEAKDNNEKINLLKIKIIESIETHKLEDAEAALKEIKTLIG